MLQSQSCSVLHPEAKAALRAAHARVTALGRVNALLEGPGLAAQTRVRTDASEFMRSLVEEIRAYASSRPLEIKVIAGRPCHLPIRQVKALGLIVNEVVTNAIKHAFPGGRSGTIRVTLTGAHGNVSLRIEDDGIGLRPPASRAGTGLGMRLIGALARQIGGAVAIDRGPEGLGTVVTVTLRSLDIIALTSMPQVP
jgi:two-component sensor histidine kinase